MLLPAHILLSRIYVASIMAQACPHNSSSLLLSSSRAFLLTAPPPADVLISAFNWSVVSCEKSDILISYRT